MRALKTTAWMLAGLFALAACAGGEGQGCGGPAQTGSSAAGDDNWHNCPPGSKPQMTEESRNSYAQPFQCVR